MNEKILPDDIESKSLSELTDIADRLIQELESKKNLEESIDDYQYLIKLNNLDNFYLIRLLSLCAFLFGIIVITVFYPFSSKLKFIYFESPSCTTSVCYTCI